MPSKVSITALTALLALAAAAQALVPIPAAAEMTEGTGTECIPVTDVPPNYDGSVPVCQNGEEITVTGNPPQGPDSFCVDHPIYCQQGSTGSHLGPGDESLGDGSGSRGGARTKAPRNDKDPISCAQLRHAYNNNWALTARGDQVLYFKGVQVDDEAVRHVKTPDWFFMTDLWDLRDRADELQVMIQGATGDMNEASDQGALHARETAVLNIRMYRRELAEIQKKIKGMLYDLMVWRDEWRRSGCAGTAPWLRDGRS
jgi:hypothetical protein